MPAQLTKYERIVTIITRKQKGEIIRFCEKNKYSAANVLREALREYFKTRGIDL